PRMRSLGFRPAAHLYAAFVLSSFMASVAGVLYVYLNRFVNPVTASLHNNVEAVLMAIVGGSGTLFGPFIGAGLVLGLRNWVSTFFELHLVVMGLVFIAVTIWAPGGVIGLLRRMVSRTGKEGQS
ncbi:MAG: branched-chain amino acid ABC transporter permease, partial [Gemmatimonas sp.]